MPVQRITKPLIKQWYALHTRSHHEKIVRAELTAKGVENFLPSIVEMHRWKDREKLVESPVFPGYVFVRISKLGEEVLRVVRTTGAVKLLGGASGIEPIPDIEIEGLQKLIETKMPFLTQACLSAGDRVKVKRGPLRHVEGTLVRVNENQGRLVLAIEMLSRAVAVEVNLRDIEVLRPPSFYRARLIA